MFEEIFVQYAAIRLNFPEYQLVIVGHSMGGSIASLTSLSFHHLNISNTLITFNSPKLWTSSVADMYDSISGTEEIKELKTDLENGYLRIWNTRDSWNLFPLNIKTPLSFGGSGMYKHSGLSIATEQSALPYSTEQFIVEYEGVGKWDHEWEKKKCTPVVDNNDLLRGMSWDAHKMLIRDIWACVDMKSDGDQ
ncbi:hypothetical protein CANARDRAFT_29241 [[Candida] arabinofermentans NRRL YB-2248]|uniref:triacylglycerol lipase n=1 Tax=[Candida] arabinofermentans NRRL YB-2248 TaxID=983967 RepID=A0A1E4SY04_9ASCO|nr:hypothetical protein CANARDRAFT_29241 [[Candida] arabinofermentans NRRL YB-2248]